jgi:hypothetical protein
MVVTPICFLIVPGRSEKICREAAYEMWMAPMGKSGPSGQMAAQDGGWGARHPAMVGQPHLTFNHLVGERPITVWDTRQRLSNLAFQEVTTPSCDLEKTLPPRPLRRTRCRNTLPSKSATPPRNHSPPGTAAYSARKWSARRRQDIGS